MAVLTTDPIDFLLDTDGDIVITKDIQWSRGLPAKAQQAKIAMLSVKGEWFINPDDGVPYWERDNVLASEAILGQKFDQLKCLTAYRKALAKVSDSTILTLTVTFDNKARVLNVAWQISTEFGDTDLSTLIVPIGAT